MAGLDGRGPSKTWTRRFRAVPSWLSDVPFIYHLLQRLVPPKPNRIPVRGRVGILSRFQDLLFSSPQLVLDSLRFLLPTAIFFVKFLEWWYSPNSPARSFASSQPGPALPPPRLLPPHPKGIPIDGTAYGQCPICRHQINNATALPSGYVFCYRCAYDQVGMHARCPVTLLPTKVWQMRKVLV
jgi:peroxin-12